MLFGDGDEIVAAAGGGPARFILVAGKPLHEPIAWAGPIVMNTQDERRLAFDEYGKGTFIKHGAVRQHVAAVLASLSRRAYDGARLPSDVPVKGFSRRPASSADEEAWRSR